jgi:molecular chaperone DnaK
MRAEAEKFSKEDRRRRQLADAMNNADNAVYAANKYLRSADSEILVELKSEVQEKMQATRQAMEIKNLKGLKRTTRELLQLIQELGTKIHDQTQVPSGGASSDSQDQSTDDDATVETEEL